MLSILKGRDFRQQRKYQRWRAELQWLQGDKDWTLNTLLYRCDLWCESADAEVQRRSLCRLHDALDSCWQHRWPLVGSALAPILVHLSSKSLSSGFVTFSRVMNIDGFVFQQVLLTVAPPRPTSVHLWFIGSVSKHSNPCWSWTFILMLLITVDPWFNQWGDYFLYSVCVDSFYP